MSGDSKPICFVCHDDLADDPEWNDVAEAHATGNVGVLSLLCGHAFHAVCIAEWAKTQGCSKFDKALKCPTCKRTASEIEQLAQPDAQVLDSQATVIDSQDANLPGLLIYDSQATVMANMHELQAAGVLQAAGADQGGQAAGADQGVESLQVLGADQGGQAAGADQGVESLQVLGADQGGQAAGADQGVESPAAGADQGGQAAGADQGGQAAGADQGCQALQAAGADQGVKALHGSGSAASLPASQGPGPAQFGTTFCTDPIVMCEGCGEICEATKARIVSKDKKTALHKWKCHQCHSKTCELRRQLGSWPPKDWEGLPENLKMEFMKGIKSMTAKDAKAKAEAMIKEHAMEEEFYEASGQFLPLSVWKTQGFDENRIAANTAKKDILWSKQLGHCYRVPIVKSGQRGSKGRRCEDVLSGGGRQTLLTFSPHLEEDQESDPGAEGEKGDGEAEDEQGDDDMSSTSSSSSSSSSSADKKRKKSKKAKKSSSSKAKKKAKKKAEKENKKANKLKAMEVVAAKAKKAQQAQEKDEKAAKRKANLEAQKAHMEAQKAHKKRKAEAMSLEKKAASLVNSVNQVLGHESVVQEKVPATYVATLKQRQKSIAELIKQCFAVAAGNTDVELPSQKDYAEFAGKVKKECSILTCINDNVAKL